MNASEAQREYQRLNTIIGNVQREIRNSTNEQNQFSEAVRGSENSADKLLGKLTRMAGAYMGIQGIGSVIDLSDKMTTSTARLDMIVDDNGSVDELKEKIYSVAQSSRADYMDTMDMIGKLGTQAGSAFKSNDELLNFADQLNKQFAIAGTNTQSMQAATLQLTQALGSGVLRGDELNSVFENAPTVMQSIAEYLGKDIGDLREMAKEGQITAETVKNALINSADETNKKFDEMPMTFGQIGTKIQNVATKVFEPILTSINNLANSSAFQGFIMGLVSAFSIASQIIGGLFNVVAGIGSFLYDNWSILAPVIWGIVAALGVWYGKTLLLTIATKAQNAVELISKGIKTLAVPIYAALSGATMTDTAAQWGLNTALYSCPLVWIIILIIALIAIIYAVIAVINKVTGSSISATGVICGAITTAVAFIWNLFIGLLDLVLGVVNAMVNPWISFANFFANLFNDPIGAILHLFGDFADSVLGVIESIANALDAVFGSNFASTVQGWRSGLSAMVEDVANEYGNGSYEKVAENLNLTSEDLGLKRWEYGDAWDTGYDFGQGIDDSIGGLFDDLGAGSEDLWNGNQGPSDIGEVPAASIPDGDKKVDKVGKVDKIGGTVDIASEDLKYLRDIFENDVIQEVYTSQVTPQVTISFGDVKETADVDSIMSTIREKVKEQLNISADAIHA